MFTCLNPVTANLPEPEDFISLAARNGFDAVDQGANYWADWVQRTSLNHVRDYCAQQNCRIGHGGLPVNFRESEEAFEVDMTTFPTLCEINKALGITGMCTWIAPAVQEDVTAYRARLAARLKRIAKVLGDFELRLGLEFVGPATSRKEGNPFIYDMAGMLAFCEEINPALCGLLLDSYHWYTSHGTVGDLKQLTPERVVLVHINDAYPGPIDELMDLKRLLPGEGVIDLTTFLTTLKAIGYQGPVSVETFSEELRQIGPEAAAQRAGIALQKVMATVQ